MGNGLRRGRLASTVVCIVLGLCIIGAHDDYQPLFQLPGAPPVPLPPRPRPGEV